jgi:DNA primase
VPLYEFAVRSALSRHDLETSEGRLAALDEAAPIIAGIKDRGLRKVYAGNLDRWLGLMDQELVLARINERGQAARRGGSGAASRRDPAPQPRPAPNGRQATGSVHVGGGGGQAVGGQAVGGQAVGGQVGAGQVGTGQVGTGQAAAGEPEGSAEARHAAEARGAAAAAPYESADPVVNLERQALKLAVQRPELCGAAFDALGADDFTVAVHSAVRELIAACGGVAGAAGGTGAGGAVATGSSREWAARLREAAPNDAARAFLTRLAVEHLEVPRADGEPDPRYADAVLARIEELSVSRQIATVKSRLQRQSPVADTAAYNRTFGDLVALEERRKLLLERAAGAL